MIACLTYAEPNDIFSFFIANTWSVVLVFKHWCINFMPATYPISGKRDTSFMLLYICIKFQLRREQEEANSMDPATPLTIGHNGNGLSPDNGHLPRSGESHPMVNLRPGSRSPTHVQFSNESGSRSSKLSMNGIVGIAQRFRNKSGSTSGEAWHPVSV